MQSVGAAQEFVDVTQRAGDRVQRDWQGLKQGTERMLDESDANRRWEAEHAPPKVRTLTPACSASCASSQHCGHVQEARMLHSGL